MTIDTRSQRIIDEDGASVEIFALRTDTTSLEELLRGLFQEHWQQITVLLPNPFPHPETDKILKTPDWSRLDLWDRLRARWFGLNEPDPFDRSGRGFRHD